MGGGGGAPGGGEGDEEHDEVGERGHHRVALDVEVEHGGHVGGQLREQRVEPVVLGR